MCVVSAVIAAMVILAAVVAELVLYYMKSEWLTIWSAISTANLNNTIVDVNKVDSISSAIFNETFFGAINETTISPDTAFNATETLFNGVAHEKATNVTTGISLNDTIFLTFISIIGILAAITVGLLLHLCFFHVYISFLGLTTYEYIRNQRQLETQKQSKRTLPTTTTSSSNNKTTLNALKKSSTANKIYFCSHIDPKNLVENHSTTVKHRPKSIYCCDTSMQYDNSTHTAFYFCSVLHDRPSPILVSSSINEVSLNSNRSSGRSKSFHCCSEYKQIVGGASSHSGYSSSTDEITHNDETFTETSTSSMATADEYIKFMEQCTFCSFKLKTKTKKSKVAAIESNPPQSMNNQRMEIDLKPMRKQKWNCCSNVPESPDSEISVNDQIDTISASIDPKANHNHINHRLRGSYDEHMLYVKNGAKPMNPIPTTKLPSNGSMIVKPIKEPISRKNRSTLSTNLKSGGNYRTRATTQTWPIRLRHMLRMFGRCQQPHYPNNSHVNNGNNSRHRPPSPSPRRNIKQNQVRPMNMLEQQCEELQQQRRQQQHQQQHQHQHQLHDMPNHLHKTALTAGRDSELETNNSTNEMAVTKTITTPAPPPPVRRKICSATTDMQELAESLSFVQNPSSHHHHHYPSRVNKQKEQIQKTQQRPLLAISRKRRKNIFRSPNLSPIHESGYSNPTSPKPCRHGSTQECESSASTPKISHQYR